MVILVLLMSFSLLRIELMLESMCIANPYIYTMSMALLDNMITTTSIVSRNNHRRLFTLMASAAVNDAKHGFARSEMYKQNLAGTVDAYDRHVFLCYKNHLAWPPRVEASDAHPLPKRLAKAWKARKNDVVLNTKMTVCEAREDAGLSDGDVLIFPDMIKYKGLEESTVDGFFDDVIVNGKEWSGGEQGPLRGSHIFVCAHGKRDLRCGVCGPALIDKFNEQIQLRGLKDQITVAACSHVGGHKYAGNVIIFCSEPDAKTRGHWYGYVTPDDVPALLDRQIAKGEVIQKLWRGQMGPPVPNGDYNSKDNLSNNENAAGCCQGVDGVSCCQNESSEENKGIEKTTQGSSWPINVAWRLFRRSG